MIRGPISLLIVGSIALFMFLLVSMGPRVFEGILPGPVLALLEGNMTIQTIGGTGERPAGDTPSDLLVEVKGGLVARGPIAAMAGNRPVFIADVIEGYKTRISKDIPVEITTIRPISGCRLTPPLEGTAVGHVTAGVSELELALLTYNDRILADAVQDFVNAYRNLGTGMLGSVSGYTYDSYDVAVTETARPVYLVLVNQSGYRIWNIHLAPGARIERVVLLGGDQAGVANLDPVVPVEVIPAAGLDDCGIVPAYAVSANQPTLKTMGGVSGSQTGEAEQKPATLPDRIMAYNTWFRDSFGVLADETRAGFDTGTISVVGPLPGEAEPKAVYAPIHGSRIRMTHDKYFEIRGQTAKEDSFAGRVKAIATTFAFGDLGYLRQGVSF